MSKGRLTTVAAKGRVRSNSFASVLKKFLPGNKAERGGTLRKRGYHGPFDDTSTPPSKSTTSLPRSSRGEPPEKLVRWNTAIDLSSSEPLSNSSPSPGTQSQRLYLERREKRRQRRSLKESGDYLGVQGINPSTGEMDVLTPSTSSASSRFQSLARLVQDKRVAYEGARRALRSEKLRKWEMEKAALRTDRRSKVRWTKRDSAWSSAFEPNLSPIEGSRSSAASTLMNKRRPTETVVRTPSVRDESSDYFGLSERREQGCYEMDGETASTLPPSAAPPCVSTSSATNHVGRNPVSSDARPSVPQERIAQQSTVTRPTLYSHSSYSDLIPVESEYPSQPPPTVGPKSTG